MAFLSAGHVGPRARNESASVGVDGINSTAIDRGSEIVWFVTSLSYGFLKPMCVA